MSQMTLTGAGSPGAGGPVGPHPGSDILQEDGDFILQEDDSSTILKEG